jgi:hypothetical protein
MNEIVACKVCTKCDKYIPLSLFGRNKTLPSGYSTYCKEHMACYRREYDEKIRQLKTILKKPKVSSKIIKFEEEIKRKSEEKEAFEKQKKANGEIVLEL